MGQEKKITLLRVKDATPAPLPKQDHTVAIALADLASSVRGNVDAARVERLLRIANRAAEKGQNDASLLIRNGPLQQVDTWGLICCDDGMTNQERWTHRAFDQGEITHHLRARSDWRTDGKHSPAPPFLVTLHKDYGIHWYLSSHTFFWYWRKLTLRWTS